MKPSGSDDTAGRQPLFRRRLPLALHVVGASRSWTVRTPTINGKRREIGLGSAAKVSLALARKHRDALLEQLRNGVDPVAERQAAKEAAAKAEDFRLGSRRRGDREESRRLENLA